MGGLYEYVKMAVQNIRANKGRSFLTMLGIIIGIASVIAIMTLGDSISSSVTESMSSMGANNVTIGVSQKSTTEETTASGMTFSMGPRFTQMSEDDYISEEMLDDLQERYADSIQGFSLEESVERAKDYISGALAAMLDLGKGSGPMDHGFAIDNAYTKEAEV